MSLSAASLTGAMIPRKNKPQSGPEPTWLKGQVPGFYEDEDAQEATHDSHDCHESRDDQAACDRRARKTLRIPQSLNEALVQLAKHTGQSQQAIMESAVRQRLAD